MNENGKVLEFPGIAPDFEENRRKFPPEELLQKYGGKHVAWSFDGKTILVSADSDEEMERKLIELGVNPAHVVGSYVPRGDEIWL